MLVAWLPVHAFAQTSTGVGSIGGVSTDMDYEPSDEGSSAVKGGGGLSPESNAVSTPGRSAGSVSSSTRSTGKRSDQDRALAAEKRGRILPYGRIVKVVTQNVPGDIIRVRLIENVGSDFIYEVTVLDDGGRYTKVSLNARTGKVLNKKRR
jgi:hypothetical protein